MGERNDYISDAVIRRLPRYYRYLGELLQNGVTRISSGELSEKMGLTASQVRQDFNHFGGFGQQGYGYNVESLYTEVARILGIDQPHNVIIIGAGHIGAALANYPNFEKRGFHVIGIFDNDPALIGTEIAGHVIHADEELPVFIRDNAIDIAVLAIPKVQALKMAELLCDYGIKGIWNFASTDLEIVNSDVIVENVHLTDSIMRLSYKLRNKQERE